MKYRNLIAIKKRNTGSGRTEVHALSGKAYLQAFFLHQPTELPETDDTFRFFIADWLGAGVPDLIGIQSRNTASRRVDVHVLAGGAFYQQFIMQVASALPAIPSLSAFVLADWNRDGRLDVLAIRKNQTASLSTEVDILDGLSGLQSLTVPPRPSPATALHPTDDGFAFGSADWDRDGIPDLFCIKKNNTGTRSTEVHILSGRSNFSRFILQTGTALHETDDTFDFLVTDWNRDGWPDIVAIKKSGTGTNSTELHILSGKTRYQTFLLHTGTCLHETDQSFDFGIF